MNSTNASPKLDTNHDGGDWAQPTRGPGKLLVLVGAKGGCGVTTVASNVAIALARERDQKILLIDLALPIGDAALCLGIAADYSTEDALRNIDRLDSTLLQSLLCKHWSGVFLLAAPTKVPELEVSNDAINKLIAVARSGFDYVIVDLGSRIDAAAEALFKYASTIYLVTQTGISELRNSNRLISQFFMQGSPNLEIVINRAEPRFLEASDDILSQALGKPVRWKIPDDQNAVRALQGGDAVTSKEHLSRISAEMASSLLRAFPKDEKDDLNVSSLIRSVTLVVSGNDELQHVKDSSMDDSGNSASIDWPALDPIRYGEKLTSDQLNASAAVAGTFVYTPGLGYVLPVGTHTLWVTFTPAESNGEAPLQIANSIVVRKATPVLTWQAPSDIPPGTALDEKQLNASASVPGKFNYSPAAGEVLATGTHTISVTFTPADEARYTRARAIISLTVGRETPSIGFPIPDPITYGTPLSAAQLCATASIPGIFEYKPGSGALLAAGEHPLSAIFTPEDPLTYSAAETTVSLRVAKARPSIDWRAPDPIAQGTPLTAAQLNATANVHGSFAYSHTAGEVLGPGMHDISATFTPTDTLNYKTEHAVVPITVVEKLSPAVIWPVPSAISYGTALNAAQLNATASLPGTFVYVPSAGHILAPGRYILSAFFIPAETKKYATVQATVELEVERSSEIASLSAAAGEAPNLSAPAPAGEAPSPSAPAPAGSALDSALVKVSDSYTAATVNTHETRIYKGAVYEKGEDGKWHLQKK